MYTKWSRIIRIILLLHVFVQPLSQVHFASTAAFAESLPAQLLYRQSSALQFSQQPISLEHVSPLGNGSWLVAYYASPTAAFYQNRDDVQDLYLEIFDASGASVWSWRYHTLETSSQDWKPQRAVHPVALQNEYYRDAELSDHYTYIISQDGSYVSGSDLIHWEDADKRYLDSVYPYHVERFTFTGAQEIPVSITYAPTGVSRTYTLACATHAYCLTSAGELLLAAGSSNGQLRVYQYNTACQQVAAYDLPEQQEQVIGIASLEQTAYCLTEYAGTYRLDRLDLTAPEKPCESLQLQLDAGAVPQGLVADTQGAILLAWDEARNQTRFSRVEPDGTCQLLGVVSGSLCFFQQTPEGGLSAVRYDPVEENYLLESYVFSQPQPHTTPDTARLRNLQPKSCAADSLTVPLPFPVSCVTGWLSLPEGATALLTEYGNDALVAMHLAVVSPDGRVLHTAPLGYRDPTSTYTQMQYTEGGFCVVYYHDLDMTSMDQYSFDWSGNLVTVNDRPISCDADEKGYTDNAYLYTLKRYTFTADDAVQAELFCATQGARRQLALHAWYPYAVMATDAKGNLWIAYVPAGQKEQWVLEQYDSGLQLLCRQDVPASATTLDTLCADGDTLHLLGQGYGRLGILTYHLSTASWREPVYLLAQSPEQRLRMLWTGKAQQFALLEQDQGWQVVQVDASGSMEKVLDATTVFSAAVTRENGRIDVFAIDPANQSLVLYSLSSSR